MSPPASAKNDAVSRVVQMDTLAPDTSEKDVQPNVIDFNSKKRSLFQWYHPDDGPVERKLILKLDLSVLVFACFGFWCLYIDRGMFINAYISGMREDLGFLGNELVQLNSIFTVGYAISIIPLTVINTRLPPRQVIPICMAIWAIFTTLLTRANSYGEVAAYRFLVGFAEGAFFPSIHYVFGSWYRPDEIARRAGLFYVSAAIGTFSTGFLAARIYADLDGAMGRAGWRWMFLVGGVVCLPVAIFGYITFPGTPSHATRWLFTESELALSRARMEAVGRKPNQAVALKLSSIKRFLGGWHFWVLVPWSVIFQQGYLVMPQGTWALWIKSNKQYSGVTVNNLTAVAPCVAIVWSIAFSWISDRYGPKSRLPLFAFAHLTMGLGHLAFVLYDSSPFGYKWFAVAVGQVENSMAPIMYSCANLICANDAEERAFILSAMLAFAMAFNSWVPIVLLPTTEAPRFFKGYLAGLIAQPLSFALAVLVYYLDKDGRRPRGQKTAL
ncbi:hypothetical protein A1O3_08631 [Capronia epimyces CBS 606.96]|uniref:Major facilitator superfamily (MFS) profile domain-containing protein n=1 Tax=Capronia epimyces CBS 606.96 TaxID=1182542 RepID=W9XP72_9EURO|nr:uncharacterized protein A1O3_08631 [Capronia epimyces CBS 606.96]EXJ79130.1 hypothetical protein A1O3_08631 [Capronia epimyces CBS 606.96]